MGGHLYKCMLKVLSCRFYYDQRFFCVFIFFDRACAYGVEPLVDKLVKEGADVNETNSYGYTPLLEACHRGFYNVVMILINGGGARLDYLPSAEDAGSSPFVNAPSQTALGEAARCGFHNIVQALIDAGARKDQRNDLGWTPLHEVT